MAAAAAAMANSGFNMQHLYRSDTDQDNEGSGGGDDLFGRASHHSGGSRPFAANSSHGSGFGEGFVQSPAHDRIPPSTTSREQREEMYSKQLLASNLKGHSDAIRRVKDPEARKHLQEMAAYSSKRNIGSGS